MWSTYILQCSDGSFYVGHTNDLSKRLIKHNNSQATMWTSCRLPVCLAYLESHENEKDAVVRERQIKRWSRAKKLALIMGDMDELKRLSKRKTK